MEKNIYHIKPAELIVGYVEAFEGGQGGRHADERAVVALEEQLPYGLRDVDVLPHRRHRHGQRRSRQIVPLTDDKRCSLHRETHSNEQR